MPRRPPMPRPPHMPPPWSPRTERDITVDAQGFFHAPPPVAGGPYRNLGEVLAAIEAELFRSAQGSELPDLTRFFSYGGGATTLAEAEELRLFTRQPVYGDPSWCPKTIFVKLYQRLLPLRRKPKPWSSWDYSITFKDGLFYTHPLVPGGPFRSLGEVAAAIKCYPVANWTYTQLLREGYSFTLKGGLFHACPESVGGPFKFLSDAMDAVWRHGEWKRKQQEKTRTMKEYLNQIDPVVCMAEVKVLIKRLQSAERDTMPPESPSSDDELDDVLGNWKPSSDPAVREAVDRFERIMEKRETIRNGVKWMENEVLQAFESAGYQGSMYEFVRLDQQCLIYDTFSQSYHHYNFTMKKKSSKKQYELFFAQVKPTKEGKQYFCCPLQSGEKNGRCFGCENVGVDLKHPAAGKYEKGDKHSGFPFDSDGGMMTDYQATTSIQSAAGC